jgi:hypothetical protein
MIYMQQKWCNRASLDGQPRAAVPTWSLYGVVIPRGARNLRFAYTTTAA